ncbi:MAG: phosphate/phosphite/phosphonate ABC transporter substrate-binding protein [Rhodocyclaceae bacterium]|nr:phosphate/phosphite/phosphonate ABC transporter substrate-binding protein [Rhodocyclaceae bacterium]
MSKLLSGTLLVAALFLPNLAYSTDCEDPRPLRFAQVPQKKADLLASQFQPLYQHLERVLGRRIEVIQAPSYSAVVEGLLLGNIDLADLGPAAYAMAKKRRANIVVFASFAGQQGVVFDTARGYHSVLVTRADKAFVTIDKLRGATVSLTDPASTSGALFPRREIARITGMPLERYFRRVSYAGSHDRAIEALQRGAVDAAFVSSTRIDEMIRSGQLRRDELRILWQSSLIPFDPFLYRGTLCKPLADKIRHAFLVDTEPLRPLFEALRRPGFNAVDDDTYRAIRDIYTEMNP